MKIYNVFLIIMLSNVFVSCLIGGNVSDPDPWNNGDSGEVFWTDPDTGYKWSGISSDKFEQEEARLYCLNLGKDETSGWRLPTIDELRTLIINCPSTETDGECGVTDNCMESECYNSFCEGCKFSEEGIYSKMGDNDALLSDLNTEINSPWTVAFQFGGVGTDRAKNFVRCIKRK